MIVKKFFFRHIKTKFFFVETYNNSKPHNIWTKANHRKKGIKNYKNMSREKLLPTLDELEHSFKNISQNGLEWIAKMQNLSQNQLKQITKMRNLPQNELEQIAKMRGIYFVKVNQITQK